MGRIVVDSKPEMVPDAYHSVFNIRIAPNDRRIYHREKDKETNEVETDAELQKRVQEAVDRIRVRLDLVRRCARPRPQHTRPLCAAGISCSANCWAICRRAADCRLARAAHGASIAAAQRQSHQRCRQPVQQLLVAANERRG